MTTLYGLPLDAAASFRTIVDRFAAAVETGDPPAIAALFSADGVYHDLVYGDFAGPAAIERMFRDKWFRDAGAFRWQMIDPVSDGRTGYAHWLHSFELKNPVGAQRVVVDGASQFLLTPDGRIERYREWTEGFGSLLRAGASRGTIDHIMFRHDDAVRARPDAARHI
jgi:ketosteroid isomerase-like protein